MCSVNYGGFEGGGSSGTWVLIRQNQIKSFKLTAIPNPNDFLYSVVDFCIRSLSLRMPAGALHRLTELLGTSDAGHWATTTHNASNGFDRTQL